MTGVEARWRDVQAVSAVRFCRFARALPAATQHIALQVGDCIAQPNRPQNRGRQCFAREPASDGQAGLNPAAVCERPDGCCVGCPGERSHHSQLQRRDVPNKARH